MKPTILSYFLLLPLLSIGQLAEDLPTNEAGKLFYSEVIQVDGVLKDDLFMRSQLFFSELFGNSEAAIKLKDSSSGIIIGEGAFEISFIYMGLLYKKFMFFSVKNECRDNRYKYEIFDIYFQDSGAESSTITAEDYFSESNYYKKNGKPKPQNESTLNETKRNIEYIKNMLLTIMARNISTEENW
jgi:hypothetical protein